MAPGEYRLYSNKKMEVTPFTFEEEQNNRIDLVNSRISIFPNPASTNLHIKGTDASAHTLLRIYDMSGRLRLQENLRTEILNIEMLPSGVYLIEALCNGFKETHRLVVSK
jgi:hypothetical protein